MPLQTLSSTLSAVRANTQKAQIHAHNIASAPTIHFRPPDAAAELDAQEGARAAAEFPNAAENADLIEETVGLMSSQKAIQANLAVLRASEKTLGVLIDIFS